MKATKLPNLETMDAFWTRAGRLICASTLAVLIGAAPSMAQSDAASKAMPPAPTLTKDEVAALAGVTVKKADPAPVSGVTVTARRSTTVSELTVTVPLCPPAKEMPDPDAEPPKLLSSYPASGSTVRGGIVILRLTFDRPMTCDGLLNHIEQYENPCPAPLNAAMFSRDRRTFLTVCTLHPRREASRRLAIRTPSLEEVDQPFSLRLENFTSLAGQPLKPYALNFYIDADSRPVQTMQEAMAQDKFLRDAQKATTAQPQVMAQVASSAQPAETPRVPADAPAQKMAIAQAQAATPGQPAQAPPAQAAARPTAVSPLTVEGTPRKVLEQQARAFVDAYGAPTRKLGVLARWSDDPACIAVFGLVAEQAAQFKTRIEAVAKTVRAPVAPPKCSPNIEIVFTTEPQRYLDAAATKSPAILGDQGAKTVTRPVQAWYATATQGVGPPPDGGLKSEGAQIDLQKSRLVFSSQVERFGVTRGAEAARRCVDPGVAAHNPRMANGALIVDIPCLHSKLLNVLVVVDAAHMGDVSVDLASDYLALVALSQPKPQSLDGCLALPSVLDLYAKDCAGREAPTGLTPADRAYLIGLYAADLTVVEFKQQSEQSDIAGRMVKILVNPNAPTVDPGLCPTNPDTGEVQCPRH